MPKVVNREDRREEICGAALRILARGGPGALTLRSLAEELNGSITLVTHFFSNRADLFEAIVDDLLSSREYDETRAADPLSPVESLRDLLLWLVPWDSDDEEREASRIALIPMRDASPSIDHFFVAMEARVRGLLASALAGVADESEHDRLVDLLRASVNGLVLSIVEHPEHWTTGRRRAVVDSLVAVAVPSQPIGV